MWRSVRVDARQYREQTYADMSWERVHPWLLRRAGNINGIDLRWEDISADLRLPVHADLQLCTMVNDDVAQPHVMLLHGSLAMHQLSHFCGLLRLSATIGPVARRPAL